jgi:hypothetical protein
MRKAYIPFVLIIIRISGACAQVGLRNSPQVNEICGMGELGFEPADEGKGVKPPLTPETLPFKVGHS